MTIEQQEQQILGLVHNLPILRRIRLALTILRTVEPSHIPVDETVSGKLNPMNDMQEEQLAEKLRQRKESYLQGQGENISRQDLMAKIYTELEPTTSSI